MEAFPHLADDLLNRAAVIYVHISFEESMHRNRGRFEPDRPDGSLEHSVPDETLTRLYRDDDWATFSAGDPDFLLVGDVRVPYVVFDNEDVVRTGKLDRLTARLEVALGWL